MSHDAAEGRYPIARPSRENRVLGHSVPRIEDLPLVTDTAAMPATSTFRTSSTCESSAPARPTGGSSSVDTSAARALPGVVAVWTNDDIADLSPIDFRADKNADGIREFRQPALARTFVRYIGDPIAAVFAEDPYIAEDAADLVTVEIEELAGRHVGQRSARRIRAGPQHRSDRSCTTATATSTPLSATPTPSSNSICRRAVTPACRWRRAAPSAATTPRATCWNCTARRKFRTAIARRSAAMLNAQSVGAARARKPCRRRLRHPRRTLSRGRAGAGRGHAVRPAGEMDRGPARAPDVRQSRAPAAPSRAHRSRQRRSSFSASRMRFSTTRALISAPTASTCRTAPCAC